MYYRTSCLVCIQQNAGSKEKEPSNIGLNCKIYNVNFESNCANDQKKKHTLYLMTKIFCNVLYKIKSYLLGIPHLPTPLCGC